MTTPRALGHAGIGYVAALALVAGAYAGTPSAANPAPPAGPPVKLTKVAVADLASASGSSVKGHVIFEEKGHGVHVVADLTGLTPGEHGFHIHEKGDCSAADGSSAGAHFNPTGEPHGAPGTKEHHAGDLGNIKADKAGVAHIDLTFPGLSLNGAESIVGLGLIVHASPDDMKTQPTGNSGARQACGVIKAQ